MSKFFLPVVLVQILLIYVLIFTSCASTSTSVSKQPKLSPQRIKAFQHQLQRMYPFLKEKGLTDNIKSLLRNLKKKRRRKKRGRRSRFIIKDSEGNPILVIRKDRQFQYSEPFTELAPIPEITTQNSLPSLNLLVPTSAMPFEISPVTQTTLNKESDPNLLDNYVLIPLSKYKYPVTPNIRATFDIDNRGRPYYSFSFTLPVFVPLTETTTKPLVTTESTTNAVNHITFLKYPSKKSHSTTESTISTKRYFTKGISSSTAKNENEKKITDSPKATIDLKLFFSAMEGLLSSYFGNAAKESRHNTQAISVTKDTPTTSMIENLEKGIAKEKNHKNHIPHITEKSETTTLSDPFLLDFDKESFRRDSSLKRKCVHHEEEDYDDEDEEDEFPPEIITTEEEDIEPTHKPQVLPVSDNAIIHKALYQSIVNSIVKEDLPCDIEGYWSSFAGGMLLKIRRHQKMLHIRLFPKTPPSIKGFLLSCGWHLRGKLPFYPRNNVITVNGFNERDRHIATFIGECRVCNGIETVTGNWLLGRASRDCRDQRASEELISDIWKREMLTALRNQRLNKLKGIQTESQEVTRNLQKD